jgi:hypothetical protein
LRLGVAILASLSLALLLRADHVASLFDEDVVLVNVLSQSLYFAAGTWLLYLAFEPYARRRWPALMISWSRLLAGRLRDPMVGRDLLLGGLVGVVLCLLIHGSVLLPSGFGHTQRAPMAQVVSPLNASRHLIFFLLVNVYTAMTLGLASLFGLFVTRGLLRIGFLALGVQFAFTYLFFVVATRTDPAWSPILLLFALIWFAVLIRVGLLPAIVSVYFYFVLQSTPLTLDFSAWYSSRMLLCFGVLGAVLVYAFHTSLAGKSPLGGLLSE